MDEVDPSDLNSKVQEGIKKVAAYLNQLANYRYHLLIYNLVKRGHIKVQDLAEDCGYSRKHIYEIIETFDSQKTTQ